MMTKMPSHHRQGLKIRTSNDLSPPKFVSCSTSYCSISLHSRFYLDSQTTYFYGLLLKEHWLTCVLAGLERNSLGRSSTQLCGVHTPI
ncbi:hypothetical protein ACHWQZ_G005578 [Mnemiopsis leidyi]